MPSDSCLDWMSKHPGAHGAQELQFQSQAEPVFLAGIPFTGLLASIAYLLSVTVWKESKLASLSFVLAFH